MKCRNCGSNRILEIAARSKDLTLYRMNGREYEGYPNWFGSGDSHLKLSICLNCGQVKSEEFPFEEIKELEQEYIKVRMTEKQYDVIVMLIEDLVNAHDDRVLLFSEPLETEED